VRHGTRGRGGHAAAVRTIGGIGSFPAGDDGVPVWAGVNLPGAETLHEALAELQSPDAKAREHGYKPHCTIAYLEEGDPLPDPLPHMPVTFTHLSVHRGEDVKRSRSVAAQRRSQARPAPRSSASTGP